MLVGQVDISVDHPGGASAVDEPPFLLASGLWPRLSLSLCLFISALSSLFFFPFLHTSLMLELSSLLGLLGPLLFYHPHRQCHGSRAGCHWVGSHWGCRRVPHLGFNTLQLNFDNIFEFVLWVKPDEQQKDVLGTWPLILSATCPPLPLWEGFSSPAPWPFSLAPSVLSALPLNPTH